MSTPGDMAGRRIRAALVGAALLGPVGVAIAAPPPPPPGSHVVLTTGDIHLRVTSQGYLGRLDGPGTPPVTAQWPGASGVEYLTSIQLIVAAKNPEAADPALLRRASVGPEWQPQTTAPDDSIRSASEGVSGGLRYVDDDGDGPRDEEVLDGRDDDFDGMIDEDFAAIGTRMLSYTMRDDTPEAENATFPERHVGFGLRCAQRVWAYSTPGFRDFVVVESVIRNESGHQLDSVFVGWRVDFGCGTAAFGGNPGDGDIAIPSLPSANLTVALPSSDPRRQHPWSPSLQIPLSPDSALCPRVVVPLRGFSATDADGDGGLVTGIASFLLLDHSTDPSGTRAPRRVGFRSVRTTPTGIPFAQGGVPAIDIDLYALMQGNENVDPTTGFPTGAATVAPGADYVTYCSVGPYTTMGNGEEIRTTTAFLVSPGTAVSASNYLADRNQFETGGITSRELFNRHPALWNAFRATAAFDGTIGEPPAGVPVPDSHGRETGVTAPPGETLILADCRDVALGQERAVTDDGPVWFDFDCDYCTGVYDFPNLRGLFRRPWTLPPLLLVDAPGEVPATSRLARAFPNPSSGSTSIAFAANRRGTLSVWILDASGRRVRTLEDRAVEPGAVRIAWDGTDDAGRRARPGVYFVIAELEGRREAAKAVIVE